MFSNDNRWDDILANSEPDRIEGDKIIIREKSGKKVRKRVKKNKNTAIKEKKKLFSKKDSDAGKGLSFDVTLDDDFSVDSFSPKSGVKPSDSTDNGFTIPRLSDIQSDDGYDYPALDSSDFRKSSADWRDTSVTGSLGTLDDDYSTGFSGDIFGGTGGSGKKSKGSMVVWSAVAVLVVLLFTVGILATNVYAKKQCAQRKVQAMSKLSDNEEATAAQVAETVESVEEPVLFEIEPAAEERVLSLVLTSVEKDLKIKLVDNEDILVRDVPWSVTVTDEDGNTTEETDDNEDGIIHMTDVSAGEYTVELINSEMLSGFILPTGSQMVSVKAKVEYKVIADIKEEIKSEKEINAAVEDNGNQAADVEVAAPASSDTVEWVESTKTAAGDEYVEATPDLTKLSSAKSGNILLALLEKMKMTVTSALGGYSVAYPVLLTDDSVLGDDIKVGHDGEHKWSSTPVSDGLGGHTYSCTIDGCSAQKGESCSLVDGKCSLCGYGSGSTPTPTPTPSEATPTPTPTEATPTPSPSDHVHNFTYISNDDGTHKRKCTDENCPGGYEEKETCTLKGDTCKYCKSEHVHSYTYKSNGDGTHKASCACGVTIKSEGCEFEDGVCKKCKQEKSAVEYSDDAQLYDASKNALYVIENESYRLAKYADYRKDSSQKFYRKTEGYKYTGWQTLDGKTYYYTKDNVPVTGDQIIGGVKYHFATDGALSQGSGTLGIDVSKYQPSINWSSVKASGVNYVIIRCGYRGSSTGVLVEDPYFKSHIKGAKAAGLKVGVYFFTTALNETEAVEEASMVAYLCQGYGIDYPVFIDCEPSGRSGYNAMSASQRTQIIKAFCNTIKSAGYSAGVYANKNWLTEKINTSELSGFKIWLAQYNPEGPTYSGRYDLWQYTSKGSVNGISGYVDMNQSYLGY